MNWRSTRPFFPLRRHEPFLSPRLFSGVAALCLTCIGVRMAEAAQQGQAPPLQAATSKQSQDIKNRDEYVGDDACRGCHSEIYAKFKQTGMGRSTSIPSPEDLGKLAKPVKIVDKRLHRVYSAYARDGKMIHEESETDAAGHVVFSESHEIAYTVGTGDVGKSYLISKGDALFVSPISYYERIPGWDLSPGYAQGNFRDFTRRVGDLCADCHTGMPLLIAGSHNRFQQPPFRSLTVGCERCHGPGAAHVAQRSLDPGFEGSSDSSIVNPQKLRPELRDDVCSQCHFAGDARVLQPGKDYFDFRPGTPLGDVVAIFSVTQVVKGNHFVALDQSEELKLSRCWRASNGRLGCISCHDPHVQRHGNDAIDFFRGRCLTCHNSASCTAPSIRRQATAPPDNCILCHMPQQPSENIGHSSLTDHRILRSQSEVPAIPEGGPSPPDLIADTKSPSASETQNLRNAALAYAQVTPNYPELGEKGFAALEHAVALLPDDPEVEAAYGKALLSVRPKEEERAAQALQKAIDLGSKSAEVRGQLARVKMQEGQITAAIDLYKESIEMDPYLTPSYLDLAQIYILLKDRKRATDTLERALKVDPWNDAAHQQRLKVESLPDESQ